MKTLSDQKLITLVQVTGDGDAFGELAKRHRPALIAFLKALGGPHGLAEEAAQESLMLAYRKLEQFRFSSSFRTWLFRIAYRERARLDQRDTQLATKHRTYQEGAMTPAERNSDLALDMQKGLSALSEQERAAIILCDAHGLSHSDAAELLSAPVGSVKTYVRRARQKMRAFLEPDEGEQLDE